MPPAPVANAPQAHQQHSPALPANFLTTDEHLWRLYDPDSWRENPVEIKHRKLLRSQRLGDEGRDLKPGPADRDRLNVSRELIPPLADCQEIFSLPPTAQLSANDKDLLWKFRFSLHRSPRSLTKFLKCVTWSDDVEAKQATEKLLPLWGQDIGIDDALELLGPGFTDRRVRAFAVERLKIADDEEIMLYLLQLVQALKFEHRQAPTKSQRRREAAKVDPGEDGLAQFLIDRAAANPNFATTFHWYLAIECNMVTPVGKMYTRVAYRFQQRLAEVRAGLIIADNRLRRALHSEMF